MMRRDPHVEVFEGHLQEVDEGGYAAIEFQEDEIEERYSGRMVEIVHVRLLGGGSIEVRAPIEEAGWLRPLFARNAQPFRVLRDLGYEVAEGRREVP